MHTFSAHIKGTISETASKIDLDLLRKKCLLQKFQLLIVIGKNLLFHVFHALDTLLAFIYLRILFLCHDLNVIIYSKFFKQCRRMSF